MHIDAVAGKKGNVARKKLFTNFASLFSMQILSYLLPLFSMPYLVATLGVEKFGLIVFSQAVVGYFGLLVDYGFSLSATKEIAENKGDADKVNEVFSSVMVAKLILCIAGCIMLHYLVSFYGRFEKDYWIYMNSYGLVIGNMAFPTWYFQGIEKMQYTAIFNIIPKIFFLLVLFFFVTETNDYIYVPVLFSLGFMLSGLFSLIYALSLGARFVRITKQHIITQYKSGWDVFIGMISSGFSSNNILLFMGLMTNNLTIGLYATVDKVIKPICYISNSLLQVIYPHMVLLKERSHMKVIRFSIKITVYYMFFLVIFSPVYYYGLIFLAKYVVSSNIVFSKTILTFLIFLPFLTSFLNIFLISNSLVFNQSENYKQTLFITFLVSLFIVPFLIHLDGVRGGAIAALLVELIKIILISLNLYYYFFRVRNVKIN